MNALNIGKTIHIIRWICKRLRRETVPPPNTVPAVLCKASARPQRNIPFFEGFSKIGNRNGNITTFTLSIEPVSALSLVSSIKGPRSQGERVYICGPGYRAKSSCSPLSPDMISGHFNNGI